MRCIIRTDRRLKKRGKVGTAMKPYKIIISVIVCCALISALAAVSAIVGSFAAGQKGPVIDVSPLPEKEAGQISDATGTGNDFETVLPVKIHIAPKFFNQIRSIGTLKPQFSKNPSFKINR